jgi:hypothetical protein
VIYQATQDLENIRQAVNLIKNDQLVMMTCKIGFRFRQRGPVCLRFQIEIDGGPGFANIDGQRCLANLTRAEQGNGRAVVNEMQEFGFNSSFNHPCIYGMLFPNCKVIFVYMNSRAALPLRRVALL